MQHKIFISHASADWRLAERVEMLLREGVGIPSRDIFRSTGSNGIAPGAQWRSELRARLDEASLVLTLITPRYLESMWCGAEFGIGWCSSKVLVLDYRPDAGKLPLDVDAEMQTLRLESAADLDRLADLLKGTGTRTEWGAQREAFLRFLEERPPLPDDVTLEKARSLKPPSRPSGVLLDDSHGQSSWEAGRALFTAGQWNDALGSEVVDFDMREVRHPDEFASASLKNWPGLIVALPGPRPRPRPSLSRETIGRIVTWVREGGRLLLASFELGDRHHGTNLGELANHFGLRFNTDLVAPEGWGSGTPYDQRVTYTIPEGFQSRHFVLKGLDKVHFSNCTTVSVEPGGRDLIRAGANQICRPQRSGVQYEDGILQTPGANFKLVPSERAAVACLAPKGLTGRGEVIGIGTWDLLCRREPRTTKSSRRFAGNLLMWLAKRA